MNQKNNSAGDKHKEIVEAAAKAGITSFLLGYKNGSLVSTHFQQMKLREAMEVVILTFYQIIDMDLERGTSYTKEHRQIYADLAKGFDELIKKTDARLVESLKNGGSTIR